MHILRKIGLFLCLACAAGAPAAAATGKPATDRVAEKIIAMENAAMQRWIHGDPSGFLEISAPDVVYFDPYIARRMDGLEALTAYYETLRGKVFADRYELIAPTVAARENMAVLTYNFVSWRGPQTEKWNCTEVYRLDAAGWRIVQTHWSLTKPELKN